MLIGLTQTKLHPQKRPIIHLSPEITFLSQLFCALLCHEAIEARVRLFDIIFMFKKTDFIIFAERFTFF